MKKQNKRIIKRILLGLGLGFTFIVLFLIIFYFCNPLSKFYRPFFKTIPYPIAIVDGKIITTKSLLQDLESLEKFYNTQDFSDLGLRVDFKTEEGQKRLKIKEKEVFNKLIENIMVEKIAQSKGIFVTEKQAGEELVTKAQEAGSTENLALNLKKLYNWSLTDFRDKVILPRLYLKELVDYYDNEISKQTPSQERIKKAHQELEQGASFEEIAKEYSEGETAENGGDLGWFRKNYLSDDIAEKAFSMKPGEFSEVITTPLGSHIIYLEDFQEKDNEKQVKLKQIFTQEGSFLEWLNKEKKDFSVKVFLKSYFWDNEKNKIKFSDPDLETSEDSIRDQSIGDPSV